MTFRAPDHEREGLVSYHIEFRSAAPPDRVRIAELNAWRTVLYRLGLTGKLSHRYGGLAFGNVSLRQPQGGFIISGTQTGDVPELRPDHYCLVTHWNIESHWLAAEGCIRPSSEALTHAAIYATAADIRCVLHVHSPEIWRHAERLAISATRPDAGYGTRAIAEEVRSLLRVSERRLLAMGGHEDGVLAFGETVEAAAVPLICALAAAVHLAQSSDAGE